MSSEEFTRAAVVKRSSKKKYGYAVSEKDGEYFVTDVPEKARVDVGDTIVGINGVSSDDFIDEDNANGLIESIRIVVVPANKIKQYEAAKEAEEAGEEEVEEEFLDGGDDSSSMDQS